jgi:hypothetical protein
LVLPVVPLPTATTAKELPDRPIDLPGFSRLSSQNGAAVTLSALISNSDWYFWAAFFF